MMDGKQGYVMIPRGLLASRPSVIAVYAALRAMSDDCGGGEMQVGYFDLACRAGIACRTARGAVAQLVAGGYVQRRGRVRWGVVLMVWDTQNDTRNDTLNDTYNSCGNAELQGTTEDICENECHLQCQSDATHAENEKEKKKESIKENRIEKDKEENSLSLSTGACAYTYAHDGNAAPDATVEASRSMSMTEWAQIWIEPPTDWREVVEIAPVYTGRQWTEQMARAFISHYASMGWRTAGGAMIRDWRQRLQKWLLSEGGAPHMGMRGQYCGARRGAMNLDRHAPGF